MILHSTMKVRRSFDSLRSLRMTDLMIYSGNKITLPKTTGEGDFYYFLGA